MLKDDVLARLAATHNVAQFVSVGAGDPPRLRHVVMRDAPDGLTDLREAIDLLLRRSRDGLVNVRTFDPAGVGRSLKFHRDLSEVEPVLAAVTAAAQAGTFSIVNEVIDVSDGGVSGVALPEVVEFAPDDTPRVVETGDVLSTTPEQAIGLVKAVYGVDIGGLVRDGERVEFSIHPRGSGLRRERITVWEVGEAPPTTAVRAPLVWPNPFSRLIGDKAFGLLVADLIGLPVPETTVIARRIPLFSFGRPTGVDDVWLRTAPPTPRPGLYPTVAAWEDPFVLMTRADPAGTEIASVLSQRAVPARWSGATAPPDESRAPVQVHGVAGSGDDFMLGTRPAEALPEDVVSDVRALVDRAATVLGPVRMEWAHDGERAWVLQMHLVRGDRRRASTGTADVWLDFDPTDGLDALRALVLEAAAARAGVRVTRPVGLTSHVGEILREAGVPAEFAG